ncbi:uncharacterized [Tachysurus ichikawai]
MVTSPSLGREYACLSLVDAGGSGKADALMLLSMSPSGHKNRPTSPTYEFESDSVSLRCEKGISITRLLTPAPRQRAANCTSCASTDEERFGGDGAR